MDVYPSPGYVHGYPQPACPYGYTSPGYPQPGYPHAYPQQLSQTQVTYVQPAPLFYSQHQPPPPPLSCIETTWYLQSSDC
jgi:hypothetical protein